jgi:GT2 family glycosyltransferase
MTLNHSEVELDVSVVVPCRNEGMFLRRCLESILQSDYPADRMEILVADGRSVDGSREIAETMARSHPIMRVIDNPDRTTPAALNRMIAVARGRYVLRFDAHSEMPPGYVRDCVRLLEQTGAWNVGGGCRTVPSRKSALGEAIATVTTHRFGVGNSRFRVGGPEGPADTVVFGAYPREIFGRIGLFDERLVRSQDYEFNARIRHSGGIVWFSPRVSVIYYSQSTVGGLCRRAFRDGLWVAYSAILAPYSGAVRHFAPAALVCGMGSALAAVAFGCATSQSRISLIGFLLPLPYVALWGCVLAELLRARPLAQALAAICIFPAFHLSYGAGTLWGMLSTLLRLGRVRSGPPACAVELSDPPACSGN